MSLVTEMEPELAAAESRYLEVLTRTNLMVQRADREMAEEMRERIKKRKERLRQIENS